MKPYKERTIDYQYHQLLKKIMTEGHEARPIQGGGSKSIFGHQMRFDLSNGFPMTTERDLSKLFKGALAEHFAFIHGARTQKELEKWGCAWWNRWVTPEKCAIFGLEAGDLGPGSYGPAWAAFPTAEGKPFDQITNVIQQLKERPYLRTHIISPWIPQYTIQHNGLPPRKVVVAPCHGYLHIFADPITKTLSVHHFQRSADAPVGLVFNMFQFAAFTRMVAQIMDYKPVELVYTTSDTHIYENQYSYVEELLSREPKPFPTVTLDPTIKDIHDFRPEHFTVTDYEAHPAMGIPTPV